MNINDYIVDQSGHDWPKIMADFAGSLPASFTIWIVNRFGDLILTFDDGSVHLLDTSSCVVKELAASKDEFADLMDIADNASNWLMIPLVDAALAKGMTLSPGQCYSFKVAPCLGGSYEIENVCVTDLEVHLSFSADILRQIKDLPDGTKIRIKVVD